MVKILNHWRKLTQFSHFNIDIECESNLNGNAFYIKNKMMVY